MPKAPEHPPTHEDRKVQKLVELIDKKLKLQDKSVREESGQPTKAKG